MRGAMIGTTNDCLAASTSRHHDSTLNARPRAYLLLAFPSTMYILAPRINPTWRSIMATKKKAAKKKATKKKAAKKK